MTNAEPLPNDLHACQALIDELLATVAEQQDQNRRQQEELQRQQEEIAELKLTITRLLQQTRPHRSERDAPGQLHLPFTDPGAPAEGNGADAPAEPVITQKITYERRVNQRKPRREEFPPHLRRVEVNVEVPPEVRQCSTHGERKQIGEERLETLVFTRPQLYVRVTVIPKYACVDRTCGVAMPPRPPGLVKGNRFDTSIASEIVVDKVAFHLPLYRQQDWFAQCGWTPRRSTLLNIWAKALGILRPMYDYYCQQCWQQEVLGVDETGVRLLLAHEPVPVTKPSKDDLRAYRQYQVLHAAHQLGKTSVAARLWAYRAVDLPFQVFDFTVSKHRDGPDLFFRQFSGTIIADCYSGFENVQAHHSDVRHAACWSHARRKIFDGREIYPETAATLLAMIRQLYDIEDQAKTMTVTARQEWRQQYARPVLVRMRAWLDSDATRGVLPKSVLGAGLRYLHSHWDTLQVYLTDGRIPLDNNDVEQLMKHVATGRRNWMFLGSIAAGKLLAVALTLITTAHRNDLDVWAYIKDLLDQLLAGNTDYESLRADLWKQRHPEHIRQYRADERRDRADVKRNRRQNRRALAQTLADAKLAETALAN